LTSSADDRWTKHESCIKSHLFQPFVSDIFQSKTLSHYWQ